MICTRLIFYCSEAEKAPIDNSQKVLYISVVK